MSQRITTRIETTLKLERDGGLCSGSERNTNSQPVKKDGKHNALHTWQLEMPHTSKVTKIINARTPN
jgi:hypothetical protein